MNDTPRTDEQINGKPCTRFEIMAGDSLRDASVSSEFARTLERELAQIKSAWDAGVSKWRENHESIPTAFAELARVMDSLANSPLEPPAAFAGDE
jgi:predicted RNase H-like HicB family nuclease